MGTTTMLQAINEGVNVNISARKNYRKPKGGRNPGLQWRRIRDNFDDLVNQTSVNPEIGSEISRLVLFGQLSKGEGMAARRYGEIVGAYERFWNVDRINRTARSPSWSRGFGGEDNEIERRTVNGTISDYERAAKRAKKKYERLQKVIAPFTHFHGMQTQARGVLDDLCCGDIPVPGHLLPDVAKVLQLVGIEFGDILPSARAAKPATKGTQYRESPARDARLVAQGVIEVMQHHFRFNKKAIFGWSFGVLNRPGYMQISAWPKGPNPGEGYQPHNTHMIEISMRNLMQEEFVAALLREAEKAGWRENAAPHSEGVE